MLEKYNERTLWNFCIVALLGLKMSHLSEYKYKYKFSLRTQKIQKNLMNRFKEEFNCRIWVWKGPSGRGGGPKRLKVVYAGCILKK